jgi:hypothetical protein
LAWATLLYSKVNTDCSLLFWGERSWGGRINFAFICGGYLAAYSMGESS